MIDALADPAGWDDLIEDFATKYSILEPGVTAAIADVTRPDTRDADMAALARSVAIPGIKDRIAAFRAASARK